MSLANQSGPEVRDTRVFIQRRARLRRVADAKKFTGWIEESFQGLVRVRLGTAHQPVSMGDRFDVEVAGTDHTAAFAAEVVDVADPCVEMRLLQGVEFVPKTENARVSMFGERCRLIVDGVAHEAISVDISENGLGFLLGEPLPVGRAIEFDVFTPVGLVHGMGKVLYSSAETDTPGRYRAGIEVGPLPRFEQDRWDLLYSMAFTLW